jgi:hypothetical protein
MARVSRLLREQQQPIDDMPEHLVQEGVRGELVVRGVKEMARVRAPGELATDIPPASHHGQRVLSLDT